jgi:hypothetical protein
MACQACGRSCSLWFSLNNINFAALLVKPVIGAFLLSGLFFLFLPAMMA